MNAQEFKYKDTRGQWPALEQIKEALVSLDYMNWGYWVSGLTAKDKFRITDTIRRCLQQGNNFMKSTLDMVKEFEVAFGRTVMDAPNIDDDKLNQLRIDLLQEELFELTAALATRNKTEVLDALVDLQYVLDGAFLELGFWKAKSMAFNEVHNSNMSKLDENGNPLYREDGKIMKGPNYRPPNLEQFVDMLK